MLPDATDAAPNQQPSAQAQFARWWQRVKTPLYIFAWLMGMILLSILVFRRDLISSRALSLMVNVGLLVYLSIQFVKVSRWVRSMPVSPWIMRLALVCVYAFFLGFMSMLVLGLFFALDIAADLLHTPIIFGLDAFLLSGLLAVASMALGLMLGLVSLVVFGIVGAVRWEMRVSTQERRDMELRAQELRANEP